MSPFGSSRQLGRLFTVDDARQIARRCLPRMIFDFVDGGADREVTLRANCADFERITLRPRAFVDVSERATGLNLFGSALRSPILLAPAGLAGVVGGGGESAIARGAARAGTKLILSTQSSESIERVAAAAPGSVWFQLYPWRDEAVVDSLVERAESAGCEALVITIDVPVVGNRVRDLRNGAVLPPRLSPSSVLDALRHPHWMKDVLLKRRLRFANLGNLLPDAGLTTIGEYVNQHLVDPSATWAFVQRIRSRWTGTLIIKGVTNVPDSQRAVALGADGLVVSNHGGRQLDGVASTISILPSVVDAVGDETVVLLDGGVRTGSDVAKALAMGARACLIGRPYLWGSAIAGQDGVVKVLDVLKGELSRTLALLGCTSIADLGPEFLDFPAEWSQKRVS